MTTRRAHLTSVPAGRGRVSRRAARSRLGLALAALSASAGIVHLSVVANHLREGVRFGVFFAALAVFQIGWAALILARPSRRALHVGAAVNGAVVIVWMLSRTTGIPFGPHGGLPEAVGLADLVSTGLEAAVIAGSLALAGGTARVYAATARAFVVLAIASVPLTAMASTADGHDRTAEAGSVAPHDDHDGDAHGHAESGPHPTPAGNE